MFILPILRPFQTTFDRSTTFETRWDQRSNWRSKTGNLGHLGPYGVGFVRVIVVLFWTPAPVPASTNIEVSASQTQPTRHHIPCQSIFVIQILPMPCSICYGSGHNRTTCPSKGDPESKPGPSKNEQSKTGPSKTAKKAIKKKKPKKKARKVCSLR